MGPLAKGFLRMPRAPQVNEHFSHYGIIVEKSGEDNGQSKKNRVMYLYSSTVHKHCGKLVCSQDWRDYELGDWIIFTQQPNEAYFGSYKCEPCFPTRISTTNSTLVQIYVHFFVVPAYISNRTTRAINQQCLKLWSPELGGAYVEMEAAKKFKLEDGKLYKGWAQYSLNPVNFNVHDEDPEGWPYEPIIYWQIVHEPRLTDKIELDHDQELTQKFFNDFEDLARKATEAEEIKRKQEKYMKKAVPEEPIFFGLNEPKGCGIDQFGFKNHF